MLLFAVLCMHHAAVVCVTVRIPSLTSFFVSTSSCLRISFSGATDDDEVSDLLTWSATNLAVLLQQVGFNAVMFVTSCRTHTNPCICGWMEWDMWIVHRYYIADASGKADFST